MFADAFKTLMYGLNTDQRPVSKLSYAKVKCVAFIAITRQNSEDS